MKALKEKRISLRSLWRRGLVILSLFALVFASCSDSGGGSGDDGRVVASRIISGAPTTLYMGAPIDLKGVKITINYVDGSTPTVVEYDKDPKYFYTVPKAATGYYDTVTGNFTAMPTYTIVYDGRNYGQTGFKVIDFMRDEGDLWQADDVLTFNSIDGITDTGFYSTGLGVTGDLTKDNKVYVDADSFDFAGLTVRATYADGAKRVIDPSDIEWMVLPDYKNPSADGKGYKGYVYMMVGADREKVIPAGLGGYRYGVTHREPLDTVYTVTKIAETHTGVLPDFFFWDANTPTAWATRLRDAGYTLQVTYSNGETKPKPVNNALIASKKIWWNNNPGNQQGDLFVMPVAYPFTKKGNPKPGITVYYRGAGGYYDTEPLFIAVNVFTKLMGIEVDAADLADVGVSGDGALNPDQDNDFVFLGESSGKETDVTNKLKVVATYQAYNDTAVTTPVTLKPIAANVVGAAPSATITFKPNTAVGPYYITTYENIDKAALKDQKVKSVKVIHEVNLADTVAMLISPSTATPAGVLQNISYQYYLADRITPNPDFSSSTTTGNLTPTATGLTFTTQSKNKSVNVKWTKRP